MQSSSTYAKYCTPSFRRCQTSVFLGTTVLGGQYPQYGVLVHETLSAYIKNCLPSCGHLTPQMTYLAFYEYFDMLHMGPWWIRIHWGSTGNMRQNPDLTIFSIGNTRFLAISSRACSVPVATDRPPLAPEVNFFWFWALHCTLSTVQVDILWYCNIQEIPWMYSALYPQSCGGGLSVIVEYSKYSMCVGII